MTVRTRDIRRRRANRARRTSLTAPDGTSYDAMSVFATRIYNVTRRSGGAGSERGSLWLCDGHNYNGRLVDVLGVTPILGVGVYQDDGNRGRSAEHV